MLIKTSKKDPSFYSIASHKKPHSFYELQVTQHVKKIYSRNTAKTLLTLQFFQEKCFWLVSEKKMALHHF